MMQLYVLNGYVAQYKLKQTLGRTEYSGRQHRKI